MQIPLIFGLLFLGTLSFPLTAYKKYFVGTSSSLLHAEVVSGSRESQLEDDCVVKMIRAEHEYSAASGEYADSVEEYQNTVPKLFDLFTQAGNDLYNATTIMSQANTTVKIDKIQLQVDTWKLISCNETLYETIHKCTEHYEIECPDEIKSLKEQYNNLTKIIEQDNDKIRTDTIVLQTTIVNYTEATVRYNQSLYNFETTRATLQQKCDSSYQNMTVAKDHLDQVLKECGF